MYMHIACLQPGEAPLLYIAYTYTICICILHMSSTRRNTAGSSGWILLPRRSRPFRRYVICRVNPTTTTTTTTTTTATTHTTTTSG